MIFTKFKIHTPTFVKFHERGGYTINPVFEAIPLLEAEPKLFNFLIYPNFKNLIESQIVITSIKTFNGNHTLDFSILVKAFKWRKHSKSNKRGAISRSK